MLKPRAGLLLAAGLLALVCRKPDFFPLKDGQKTRYTAAQYELVETDTVETESRTYSIAVTGSGTEAGLGKVYEVSITRDEEPYMSFFFRKTPGAVYALPAAHLDGLEPTTGWVKLLELPLRPDAFWYGDAGRSVSFEVMALGAETLGAQAYRNCFRIRIHAAEPYLMDFWLAPDAGIVKWIRRFGSSRFEVVQLSP